jgi:hypothetical protein
VLFSPILFIHICAGMLALLSGSAAVVFRKGSPRHIFAGRIFVVAMLTMGFAATYLAIIKHESSNIGAGLLTFYLVGTAWLTAKRKDGETSRWDWLALLIPLTLGILTWMSGVRTLRTGATSRDGVPVFMTFFIGSICLLLAVGDVRMLVAGGLFGAKRIARHLWRMCFGLFIASGSFFLGGNNRPLRLFSRVGIGQHLPSAIFSTGPYVLLTILPLILLIFWLIRIRLTSAAKRYAMARTTDALPSPRAS